MESVQESESTLRLALTHCEEQIKKLNKHIADLNLTLEVVRRESRTWEMAFESLADKLVCK